MRGLILEGGGTCIRYQVATFDNSVRVLLIFETSHLTYNAKSPSRIAGRGFWKKNILRIFY